MIGKAETKATSRTADHVAEAEPEQEQRRVGEAGDRRADADQRQEDVLRAARASHGKADRDAGDGRERKPGEQPDQRVEHMVRQDAVGGEADKAARPLRAAETSVRGKMPRWASNSQARATTRNGNAVRAISRQRLSPRCAAGRGGKQRRAMRRARQWTCAHDSAAAPRPDERGTALACVPRAPAMDLRPRGCYDPLAHAHNGGPSSACAKRLAAALAIALTLAAGVAGGFAARSMHLPLPWLLGALFTTMALSLAGAPVRLIPWGRPAGTVVVGASTGLQFTATVVAKLRHAAAVDHRRRIHLHHRRRHRRVALHAAHRDRPHHRILRHRPRRRGRDHDLLRNMAGSSSPSWSRRRPGWRSSWCSRRSW